jgi:hypothetical protein
LTIHDDADRAIFVSAETMLKQSKGKSELSTHFRVVAVPFFGTSPNASKKTEFAKHSFKGCLAAPFACQRFSNAKVATYAVCHSSASSGSRVSSSVAALTDSKYDPMRNLVNVAWSNCTELSESNSRRASQRNHARAACVPTFLQKFSRRLEHRYHYLVRRVYCSVLYRSARTFPTRPL